MLRTLPWVEQLTVHKRTSGKDLIKAVYWLLMPSSGTSAEGATP